MDLISTVFGKILLDGIDIFERKMSKKLRKVSCISDGFQYPLYTKSISSNVHFLMPIFGESPNGEKSPV